VVSFGTDIIIWPFKPRYSLTHPRYSWKIFILPIFFFTKIFGMSALIYHGFSSRRIIKLFFFCLKDLICISDTTNKDKPNWSIMQIFMLLFLSQKYINSKTNSLYQCVSSFSFLILFYCYKSLEKLELFGEQIGNMERQLWASAFLSKIFAWYSSYWSARIRNFNMMKFSSWGKLNLYLP